MAAVPQWHYADLQTEELMNLKSPKLYIILAITFVVVFLMNYIGNGDAPDRLERALMTGFAGAVGLGIGLWIYSRGKNDDRFQNFD